jgi:FAD:protein FMN transferase
MRRDTRLLMGMPITVEIVDDLPQAVLDSAYDYFTAVDRRFSTYKDDSEISAMNRGEIADATASTEMREVLALADRTRNETEGYFDIRRPDGSRDPSGIVKGWAIRNAARLIAAQGARNFYVEAGGDIQTAGHNAEGGSWLVGIRNPFSETEVVKAVRIEDRGIATSGSYVRGQHIYDPHRPGKPLTEVVSLTVIGADVLEADRFATAAFAMGREGIYFLQDLPGAEAYMIDSTGRATMTTGFKAFVTQ